MRPARKTDEPEDEGEHDGDAAGSEHAETAKRDDETAESEHAETAERDDETTESEQDAGTAERDKIKTDQ